MEEHLIEDLQRALPVLQEFLRGEKPTCGIILGSGLNTYAETLENARALPFCDVPCMKTSTALGHVGRFVLGTTRTGVSVLCMQGRLHGYEGNSAQEVAFPVWLMGKAGIDTLITTNAAGAINPQFSVGDFCAMTDHINFTGRNPLAGTDPDRMSMRFVGMKDAYDPKLVELACEIARRENITLRTGVYLGLLGPSFETPAEIRAFAALGADTVAMSVVEEVIAARHAGMRVFGCSLVSNMACGVDGASPDSDDIMDVAHLAEEPFARLIDALTAEMAGM